MGKITVGSMKEAEEEARQRTGQDVCIHWPGGFVRAPRRQQAAIQSLENEMSQVAGEKVTYDGSMRESGTWYLLTESELGMYRVADKYNGRYQSKGYSRNLSRWYVMFEVETDTFKDANTMAPAEQDRHIVIGARVRSNGRELQYGTIVGRAFDQRTGEYVTIQWDKGHRSNCSIPALHGWNKFAVAIG